VIERRDGARLAEKPRRGAVIDRVVRQHEVERDHPAERHVFRAVHNAHAACA
jgi:hypothetical protein